jgi:two-component system LytT family response regulator
MDHKIRTVIAEDVEAYLQTIELLVREVAPEVDIAGKASSLAETERVIREVKPELLLLDIQFEEEGATVFDLLDHLLAEGPLHFRIIFITAHLEPGYFSRAFDFGALHFLSKPIDPQKLREAISRVFGDSNNKQISSVHANPSVFVPGTLSQAEWTMQLRELKRQIQGYHSPGKMVIEGLQFNEVVEIGKIGVLEASGKYTNILLNDGKNYTSSQNLGLFERKLQIHPQFVRIHHNKIINLNYVKRFSRKERNIELVVPFGSHAASKERFRDFLNTIES